MAHLRLLTVSAFACALALCRPLAGFADPPTPDAADVRVSTLAGSGAAGFRDGTPSEATFLEPVGVAAGAHGEVFVADAAAQRIRRVDAAGRVSTVAGSGVLDGSGLFVAGGYRDGAADQARFDTPSGLTIAPDGALIVADRRNHCLRRIVDGVVSTYAGSATESGAADGSLSTARFAQPMAVAFDRKGDMFVADFGNGVRWIDPVGHVMTPALPKGRGLLVTSVATAMAGSHEVLYVALQSGVLRIDLSDGQNAFFVAGMPPVEGVFDSPDHIFIDARRDLGTAYGIAPFGDGRFVYTDLQNHAIRIIWDRRARVLAGGYGGDTAPFAAGAFRDGTGAQARFDAPLGIARIGLDRFAIADAGNRRLRLLTVRTAPEETLEDLTAAKASFRIVFIGNSYVDYDGDSESSISSLLQRTLRAGAPTLGLARAPRVFTVKLLADVAALGGFIRNYFAGSADLVVWDINGAELAGLAKPSDPPAMGSPLAPSASVWQPVVERELRETRDALAANHTRLLVALTPLPWEVSPVESAYQRLYDFAQPPFDVMRRDGELLRESLTRSGVDEVDLFPAFTSEERADDRFAEFGTLDHHFSAHGRALVAREIAAAVARLKPWLPTH